MHPELDIKITNTRKIIMNEFTTLERIDILTGNVKGLANLIASQFEIKNVSQQEALFVYNTVKEISEPLYWYVDLLHEAVQELKVSEKFK